jgi:hypothetical protein
MTCSELGFNRRMQQNGDIDLAAREFRILHAESPLRENSTSACRYFTKGRPVCIYVAPAAVPEDGSFALEQFAAPR